MLLSVREVSQVIGTNRSYVYRLIDKGLLKAIKLGSIKVRKETLEKFLEEYEGQDVDSILKGTEDGVN